MEIEYSNEVRGRVHAYRFASWENKLIARALKPEIKKLEKKIDRIDNNPRNEGQSFFLQAKKEIRMEIADLQEIINEFSNDK